MGLQRLFLLTAPCLQAWSNTGESFWLADERVLAKIEHSTPQPPPLTGPPIHSPSSSPSAFPNASSPDPTFRPGLKYNRHHDDLSATATISVTATVIA
ncbi:hypothetical protein EX30DRAFT_261016 [Ascodesmis nigricans]|uniref:Secreted protein n=1 Tax=Ascodesmis nigricans TaxID=341454 RepID=A0A4S2MXF6_9PEZI|nr:hypothetical protein EX30DRAFT_261016 [Ascodesmis nigricans]